MSAFNFGKTHLSRHSVFNNTSSSYHYLTTPVKTTTFTEETTYPTPEPGPGPGHNNEDLRVTLFPKILDHLELSIAAADSRIKKLQEEMGEDAEDPLPNVDLQFDTNSQLLVLNLKKLINEFGEKDNLETIPMSNPADLDLCDNLKTLTSTMLALTETASEIQSMNTPRT